MGFFKRSADFYEEEGATSAGSESYRLTDAGIVRLHALVDDERLEAGDRVTLLLALDELETHRRAAFACR